MDPLTPNAVDVLHVFAGLLFFAALIVGALALAWLVFAPKQWRHSLDGVRQRRTRRPRR